MANNQDYTIRVKRGTANEWAVYNPILGAGELGYDTTNKRLKVGDGLNVWSNVKFATGNSFDVARDAGFDGTLSEWLESLKGPKGDKATIKLGTVTVESTAIASLREVNGVQYLDLGLPRSTEPSIVPGPPNQLGIGTVSATTGSPSASISGTYPNQKLNLTLKTGATGSAGPANSLTMGTVTESDTTSSASITGTSPNQKLNLTLRRGAKGDTGATPQLSVGATNTTAPGTNASVSISGTQLTFSIPQGAKGDTGTVNNITSESLTDSGAVGRSVVKSATQDDALTALGANKSVKYLDGSSTNLNAGTETYPRFWSAKILTDWLNSKISGFLTSVASADITDATTVGKALLTATSTTTGRSALGLGTGALAGTGTTTLINAGTSNSNYVWTPKILSDFVKSMILPDTGWRNIATYLNTELFTVDFAEIRRRGDEVTFRYATTSNGTKTSGANKVIIPTASSPVTAIGAPRGRTTYVYYPELSSNGSSALSGLVYADGSITEIVATALGQTSSTHSGYKEARWTTDAAWPSTLPGTPI